MLLSGAAYGLGRLLSVRTAVRTLTAAAVAAGCAAASVLAPGALTGEPAAPPLGYGNANGALVVLGTAAALVVALDRTGAGTRAAGVALSAVFLPLAALTASSAATLVCAALLALGLLLALRPTAGRPVPVLGCLVVVLALATTTGLALRGPDTGTVQTALSVQRVVLWADAVELLEQEPLRGQGVGGFAREAPAAADPDLRWAHSLWLQQAAETGLPGLVLLLAPTGLVLLRVRADGWEDGGVPALGAAATAGLLVHASVDYVFHFPVVLALAGLLAGLTLAPRALPVSPGARRARGSRG